MKTKTHLYFSVLSFSLALGLFILCPSFSTCQELTQDKCPLEAQDTIFKKANQLYQQSKFSEAVDEYETILKNGFESGNLYYNLGNSYFKTAKLGMAILNYERAKRLIPRDSDLQSNEMYVLSRIPGYIQPVKRIWSFRVPEIIFSGLSADELTLLLSGIYIFIICLLIIKFLRPVSLRWVNFMVIISSVIFLLGSFTLYERIRLLDREGIIVVSKAEAKFEPFVDATTFFEVPQGAKVEVIEGRLDWNKIRRYDGKKGWIQKDSIVII